MYFSSQDLFQHRPEINADKLKSNNLTCAATETFQNNMFPVYVSNFVFACNVFSNCVIRSCLVLFFSYYHKLTIYSMARKEGQYFTRKNIDFRGIFDFLSTPVPGQS